jgi:molybdenum cofactor cytidylyltransferase
MKLIGVLLAAGRSTRMGRPKQLLPWPPNAVDSKPLVAAAFDAIACVCDAMVVVVGQESEAVIAALGERKFRPMHVDPTVEMITSVKVGILTVRVVYPTADVLLHPSDHPEVRRETLDLLINTAAKNPGRAVMPTYKNEGGHPVLIPASLCANIMSYAGSGGLRQFWIDHAEECLRLPVIDPKVVVDVDTPADYESTQP